MGINEYVSNCLKTESIITGEGTDWRSNIPLPIGRIAHASMGITTEIGEVIENIYLSADFDQVNMVEELGDILWYCCILADTIPNFDISKELEEGVIKADNFNKIGWDSISFMVAQLSCASAEIADVVKRTIWYRVEGIDYDKLRVGLSGVVYTTLVLALRHSISLSTILSTNASKLSKRYMSTHGEPIFSAKSAVDRDISAERKVLERPNNE